MPTKAAGFDTSKIEDDKFYQVRLSKSTVLNGDPIPAAASPRLSGASVKLIAADVLSADEVAEDAPHAMEPPPVNTGPIATS